MCLVNNTFAKVLSPNLLFLRSTSAEDDFVQPMAVLKQELPSMGSSMTLNAYDCEQITDHLRAWTVLPRPLLHSSRVALARPIDATTV